MHLVALVLAVLYAPPAARADTPLVPAYQKLCDGGANDVAQVT